MPDTFEDDDEDFDEREYPEDDEADWNSDPAPIPCPHCGGDIVEDSQWCPHCKQYISEEDAPRRKSIWLILGVILLIILIAMWFK